MYKLPFILLFLFSTGIAQAFYNNCDNTFISGNDSLNDVFPLAVGNLWIYSYHWSYFSGGSWGSYNDTGSVTLQVINKDTRTDTIIWSLQETFNLYRQSDTNSIVSPIQSIDTLNIVELIQGHHQLITQGTNVISIFTFYRKADTVVYRYSSVDSLGIRSFRSDYDGEGFIFSFKQGVGLISIIAIDMCTCIDSFHGNYSLRSLTLTEVKDRQIESQSEKFNLFQNYPNPFNPSTTISFFVPFRSFVSLKIIDCIGREVGTIISEELSSGYYSRNWNASNIPSGVYYCRLQINSFSETKKLILLK